MESFSKMIGYPVDGGGGALLWKVFSQIHFFQGGKWCKKNNDYIIYHFLCAHLSLPAQAATTTKKKNNTKKKAPTLVFPFLKENPFLSIDLFES